MTRKPLDLSLYALLTCCFAVSSHTLGREARPVYSSLTAHEWGLYSSQQVRSGRRMSPSKVHDYRLRSIFACGFKRFGGTCDGNTGHLPL